MSDINADVTENTITVSVSGDTIAATVSGGQGPQGPQGASGVSTWAEISGKPTTLSGYGITDGVTTSDARLTDSREWSASTVTQAEAEAGTATTRRAFTAQRVFEAIAAWWSASGIQATIDGKANTSSLAAVATSGSYTDLSGGKATLPGYTNDSSLKVGTVEFQSYAVNNGWISENCYFNGITFRRRAAGAAGLFYFQGSEGQFRFDGEQSANTVVATDPVIKFGLGGVFAVGAALSNANGSVDNAFVWHDGVTFGLGDATDTSKRVSFDVSAVSADTTQTLTVPDASGTIALVGHTHSASAIDSGTLDAARLPTATASAIGAVQIGSGVSVDNNGVISVSTAYASSTHSHGNISNSGAIGVVSGLPVRTGASGVLTTGSFGSTAGTFCEGSDSRLSDSRTPLSHTHGNITNAGAIGSTANQVVVTTTSGVLTTATIGSGLTLSGGTLTASGGGGGSSVGSDLFLWSTFR